MFSNEQDLVLSPVSYQGEYPNTFFRMNGSRKDIVYGVYPDVSEEEYSRPGTEYDRKHFLDMIGDRRIHADQALDLEVHPKDYTLSPALRSGQIKRVYEWPHQPHICILVICVGYKAIIYAVTWKGKIISALLEKGCSLQLGDCGTLAYVLRTKPTRMVILNRGDVSSTVVIDLPQKLVK